MVEGNSRGQANPASAGSIDDVVSDKSSGQFFKDILEVGWLGALGVIGGGYNLATGNFNAGLGLLNAGSVAGSFALAHSVFEKDKVSPKSLMNELKMGFLYTPAIFAAFSLINPYVAAASTIVEKVAYGAAGMALALPGVLSHYLASENIVKSYKSITDYVHSAVTSPIKTVGGTAKYVFDNIYDTVKHGSLLIPFVIADMILVPFQYQLVAAAALRFGFRGLMAIKDKKNDVVQNPTPSLNPAYGGAPGG